MTNRNIYCVLAEFRDKSGNFPEYPGGVSCAYKSKAAAKKRFQKFVSSGVYDRVMIVLQNAVYLPEDRIAVETWEK